jgi:D-alanyl-D-alanine carboxypeptidase (penicillin-binding protein 5/6)
MMTTYLALEHIRKKKVGMADRVSVSRAASRVGGHQVYLRQGEVFRFERLLKAVMIGSANDAAYAVAEHVAGNERAFVRMMNQRARLLGLSDTRFVNVNGLPAGRGKPANLMSARDAAILARRLIRDFPFVLQWTSTRMTPFRPGKFNLYNTNKLVGRFAGLDGLKTGFTPESGFSIVATAKRGDLRLISVVLGSPQSQRRFDEARNLLAWGFSNYPGREAKQKAPDNGRKRKTLKQNPGGASLGTQVKPHQLTLGEGDPGGLSGEEDAPRAIFASKPAGKQREPGVIQLR